MRIVHAAAGVFEQVGFDGARIDDIAAAAGVAVATVYKVLTNKRTLLKEAISAAVTGDGREPVEDLPWFREQLDEPSAEQQLRLIARNARAMYERSALLLEAARVARDPEIDATLRDFDDKRRSRAKISAERLAAKAPLRVPVSVAACTLWALTAPELYVLQVNRSALAPLDYERWLADLLAAALLMRRPTTGKAR
jgi:AcrR family transcriptional regulator